MSRSAARKKAFVLCYQMSFFDAGELGSVLKIFFSENDVSRKDMEYITQVVTGVFDSIEEIDGIIARHSRGWESGRIDRIDKAIMRLCIFEMLKMDDIPTNVSINEAVELAKKFGADDSAAFVNGVLGAAGNG